VEEKVTLAFFKFLTLKPRNIIKVYCFVVDIKAKSRVHAEAGPWSDGW